RSQFPTSTIFPKPGQIWEVIRECELGVETVFACSGPRYSKLPLPGGGAVTLFGSPNPELPVRFGIARLQKGEQVRVLERADMSGFLGPKPICASLRPLRYEELEAKIVSPELLAHPGYKGYRLFIRTARPRLSLHDKATFLNEAFTLIQD